MKNRLHTDTFYNKDGPQKHDAKGKKPDIKDYILYSSIYRECSEKTNLQRQKDEWLPGVGVGVRLSANKHESTFGGKITLKLDCGDHNSMNVCKIIEWHIFYDI